MQDTHLNPWSSDRNPDDSTLYDSLRFINEPPQPPLQKFKQLEFIKQPLQKPNIHNHPEISNQISICKKLLKSCSHLAAHLSQSLDDTSCRDMMSLSQLECITIDLIEILQGDLQMSISDVTNYLKGINFSTRELRAFGYYINLKNLKWTNEKAFVKVILDGIESKLHDLEFSMNDSEDEQVKVSQKESPVNLMDEPDEISSFKTISLDASGLESNIWGSAFDETPSTPPSPSKKEYHHIKMQLCKLLSTLMKQIMKNGKIEETQELILFIDEMEVTSLTTGDEQLSEWFSGLGKLRDFTLLAVEKLLIVQFEIAIEEIAKFLKNPPPLPLVQLKKSSTKKDKFANAATSLKLKGIKELVNGKNKVQGFFNKSSTATATIVLPLPTLEWTTVASPRNIPKNVQAVGFDHQNNSLYICRILNSNELVLGQVSEKYKGIAIPTITGEKFIPRPFEILSTLQNTRWVTITGRSSIPDRAVVGGYNKSGSKTYVARAEVRNSNSKGNEKKNDDGVKGMVLGFATDGSKGATVCFAGKTLYSVTPFEVLVHE